MTIYFDKRDRLGTNGYTKARPSRITFMANAKGWVMCRHPGCTPFTVMEKEWLAMPVWSKELAVSNGERQT